MANSSSLQQVEIMCKTSMLGLSSKKPLPSPDNSPTKFDDVKMVDSTVDTDSTGSNYDPVSIEKQDTKLEWSKNALQLGNGKQLTLSSLLSGLSFTASQ